MAGWTPGQAPLMTSWGEQINPDSVLMEYPRPQLVRPYWKNLNGLWQFELATSLDTPPFNQTLEDTILVPFPIESALSGVMQATDFAWYRKIFSLPQSWNEKRVLLHFGAVDWKCKIYLNQQLVFEHQGGYDPFVMDISDNIHFDQPNELIVGVYDPTEKGGQPVGKQMETPQSIFFTAVTGIWQTVWLEAVPDTYIKSIKLVPNIDQQQLTVRVTLNDEASVSQTQVQAVAFADSIPVDKKYGYGNAELILKISNPHLWSPEDPYLYNLRVTSNTFSGINDTVYSYFGMRKISLMKDEKGRARLALNNKIYFQMGPLDQGYWPDGLYTAPSDEALKYDILEEKRLGFNMVRKHVKVEPDRWYYWCDRLGILVWQDMPNGSNNSLSAKDNFSRELTAMVENLFNHPSIVMWIIFNENWGKFEVTNLVNLVRSLDSTRLINANSGWNVNGYDDGVGDVNDIHHYEEPQAPMPESDRAIVCGEYGGLWRQVEGHTWTEYEGAGYQSGNALANRYVELTHIIQDLIEQNGLSGAVYTEITDVEREYAGLVTYDRKVEKCFYLPIYYANQNLIATKIEQKDLRSPAKFNLWQNYPNPFNGQTTIYFSLPIRTKVSLKLYDVAGKEIMTLVKGTLNTGLHNITFDASGIASGIYFYRLTSTRMNLTRKMILLR
ncbi:MAG: T9SS type A sorting domain-containing protein [Caldisericaceae bacterium]|nr:T9SS type A sorting domain-containing protein [Caldisericaceae bacterium]